MPLCRSGRRLCIRFGQKQIPLPCAGRRGSVSDSGGNCILDQVRCFSGDFQIFNPFQTTGTNIFSFICDNVFGAIAKHTRRPVFPQNNGRALHINLQIILFIDLQRAAQFDRQHNPAKLIHLAHNACRFGLAFLLFVSMAFILLASSLGLQVLHVPYRNIHKIALILIGIILSKMVFFVNGNLS